MSKLDDEINDLSLAAVDIALIQKPELRHRGGFWLHSQLVELFENHIFTEDQRFNFMAVVKILLDVIFRDAIEEVSDMQPLLLGETYLKPLIEKLEVDVSKMDQTT